MNVAHVETRLDAVRTQLANLYKLDPLDFWEETQTLEREQAQLEQQLEVIA